MKIVSDKSLNLLLLDRLSQILADMHLHATRPITISFDSSGTHLYSILEHSQSYPKRFCDLAAAIKQLANEDQIVPASVLARNLIETLAVGCLFIDEMNNLLSKQDLKKLEQRFEEFITGRDKNPELSDEIYSAMNYLTILDAEYVSSLELKTGHFSDSQTLVNDQEPSMNYKTKNLYERMSVKSCYDQLSLATHPSVLNGLLYPQNDDVDEDTKKLYGAIRFSCFAAIGHGRHLVLALKRMDNFGAKFKLLISKSL